LKKWYLIKKGNNGATYIFNTKDISSMIYSLKYYKTFTFRQYLVKTFLFSNLIITKYFASSKLIDVVSVKEYLKKNTLESIDFDIDEDSSILISPTKDKIIVHKHNESSFIKYAFGQSLDGVKNESNIYKLFDKQKNFNTSIISEFYSDKEYCKFKLQNKTFYKKNDDLVEILSEFFLIKNETISTSEYFDKYFPNISDQLKTILSNIIENLKDKDINIGLTHKDFKPWNIDMLRGPLIYDFEETCLAFPTEDLINYYIDPIISYASVEDIIGLLNSENLNTQINKYKTILNIDLKNKFLISQYLLERVYFWENKNKKEISNKYFEILKAYINE